MISGTKKNLRNYPYKYSQKDSGKYYNCKARNRTTSKRGLRDSKGSCQNKKFSSNTRKIKSKKSKMLTKKQKMENARNELGGRLFD